MITIVIIIYQKETMIHFNFKVHRLMLSKLMYLETLEKEFINVNLEEFTLNNNSH